MNLLLGVELGRAGHISGWRPFLNEGELVWVGDQHLAIKREFVRNAVRIDGNSAQMFGRRHFPKAGGNASILVNEASDGILQIRDILVDLNGAQMFQGILANVRLIAVLVRSAPEESSGREVFRVFRRIGREHFQKWVGIRNFRSAFKYLGGFLEVF